MQSRRLCKIMAGCVLAAVVAAVLCLTNIESNPVWNEVRVDGTVIRAGQSWGEMRESLEGAGFESEVIAFGFVPRKEGALTGLNICQSVSGEKERVGIIYYTVRKNETDCAVELAGIRLDQGGYEDISQIAGPEDQKTEREEFTIYTWIDRDKKLMLRTDKEGRILDFDLYYDRKGFK